MPTRTKRPPRGLAAIPWRLPIWLYRLHLGWLLGQRFLLLTHRGRKSGLPRQAVIEVIHHDARQRTWYVASGFGEKSDWYRNVMKTPQVQLQIGRRRVAATARRLPSAEAEGILRAYAREHPRAVRLLGRLLGLPSDDPRRLAAALPVLALTENEPEGDAPFRRPQRG